MRVVLLKLVILLLMAFIAIPGVVASETGGMIDSGLWHPDCDAFSCDGALPCQQSCRSDSGLHDPMEWLSHVRVGYDNGFLIASDRELDLNAGRLPFRIRLNGWGQLRHTITDYSPPSRDLNQFQLKRGRLVFSGSAFTPDFSYFIQLDGRSSSGDDVRLLDYYLNYDFGHARLGLEPHTISFRTGKYKMPFTMARWMSGREFEFSDRSVSSMFFDVNRSFAWGLYGETDWFRKPIVWETALFNGLVTGGAETGSSGTLDDNFALSGRMYAVPIGEWGHGEIADFQWHRKLAMRVGFGFAFSEIDRAGTTEFNTIRVVDSGATLSGLLPGSVRRYQVALYSVDTSFKYRGWSATLEHYFRSVADFQGANVPDLFDHGFWFQLGCFVVPHRLQALVRWSRVQGNSGTLGVADQSSEEVSGALALYFRENHAKAVVDLTYLDGAPINSSSLDITPGNRGWLVRSQIQFSF